ncbi:MAG: DNA polymerase III subunit epsilon [Ideonella sp.]|nr:DNA polymerase III subunit epsilon [Ideonella sp.]MBE7427356.1 DNA polymerase III subunit epsilon [Ideonella sp.]MCC7459392.1 DNA polymerase III subunit epsilon [Nitrospira sp.]
MRQIFIDTETTGLSPEHGDRVVEIGCVEFVNRRLTGRTLHHYLNPQRANSADALKVHGISDEFLADKPLFAAVADELLEFIGGAEIVAHNAAFDVAFIDAELARAERTRLSAVVGKVTDTLALARELYPGKSNSLDALCRRLEVDNTNRTLHGALLDANLLAEVYIRMTRGQDSLVMETAAAHAGGHEAGPAADLSVLDLAVIEPTAEERAAHEAWLADLDKASGGRTVWRTCMA